MSVDSDGDVKVIVGDGMWTLNPRCLTLEQEDSSTPSGYLHLHNRYIISFKNNNKLSCALCLILCTIMINKNTLYIPFIVYLCAIFTL